MLQRICLSLPKANSWKLNMLALARTSRPWQAEVGGSRVHDHHWLYDSLRPTWATGDPVSTGKQTNNNNDKTSKDCERKISTCMTSCFYFNFGDWIEVSCFRSISTNRKEKRPWKTNLLQNRLQRTQSATSSKGVLYFCRPLSQNHAIYLPRWKMISQFFLVKILLSDNLLYSNALDPWAHKPLMKTIRLWDLK